MATKAGQIVIDIDAGTAKFVMQMEQAKAKIREFGSAGVSEHRAVAAAMKELEGSFLSNRRAADAFLAMIPGLGEALKVAFPAVGAIAFAGVLAEVGTKAQEFFKNLREEPEKSAASWRTLNASVRTANDELELANARLEADIAKLMGKRQNNLAIALAEAKVEADKLGESLQKDLDAVTKLLNEHELSFLQQIFTGQGNLVSDALKNVLGGESGVGGMYARLQQITARENAALDQLKTGTPNQFAGAGLGIKVQGQASPEDAAAAIRKAADAERLQMYQNIHSGIQSMLGGGLGGTLGSTDLTGRDREMLQFMDEHAQEQIRHIQDESANAQKTAQKGDLEAQRGNENIDKPYKDRMTLLQDQLKGVRTEMEAIGKPVFVQEAVKAFADANKVIDELNKRLGATHQLTGEQQGKIHEVILQTEQTKGESDWQKKLFGDEVAITNRIESLRMLTAAIGQGYEATKRANVETEVANKLAADGHDATWVRTHQSDVEKLRTLYGQQYDTEHQQQATESVQKLNEQIGLEQDLAASQAQGAEAVRQATLAHRLAQIARDNDAQSARKLTAAEIELFNAERANANAQELATLNQKVESTERLANALGIQARREAEIENIRQETLRRTGSPEMANAAADAARIDQQAKIQEDANSMVSSYADRLQHVDELMAAIRQKYGETLEGAIALRDLENQRLKILVEANLQLGSARDGVRAFFLEMQEDAEKASKIIYDALNHSVDGLSDNLAKMATGKYKKGDFGKSFENIGEQAMSSTIKSTLQSGLGEIGRLFGIHGAGPKPDGSSADRALWVRMAHEGTHEGAGGHAAPGGGDMSTTGGLMPSGPQKNSNPLARILSLIPGLGGLFGRGGASNLANMPLSRPPGLMPDISVEGDDMAAVSENADFFGGFMAEGGDVDPGRSYIVGDAGEPELFTPSTAGRVTPLSRLGGDVHYHIDARGAELGVENRIRQQLEAVHASAVSMSVRAGADNRRRTPQRG